MYSIGQFSRLTSLTVKTLRHYHDKGILLPTHVDEKSGYRFYDRAAVERARVITVLRQLELSLEEIAQILDECRDDEDALAFLEKHRAAIQIKLERYQAISNTLDLVVSQEREAVFIMRDEQRKIEERHISAMLIAGVRNKGRYDESGERFKKLGRAYGFSVAGKPGNLVFDDEYKESDADFESYFPIKKEKAAAGIEVRTLGAARCLTLVHVGPYDQIHRTYRALLDEIESRGMKAGLPSREIYIKGPGMIFKGNPKNYVTEVQIPVEE